MRTRLQAANNEVKDIFQQKEGLESRLQAAKNQIEDIVKEKEGLESRLQAATNEVIDLVKDKDGLAVDLQGRESQVSKLQRKVEKLTDARNSTKAKCEELETWKMGILQAMGGLAGGMLKNTTATHKPSGPRNGHSIPARHSKRRTFQETCMGSEDAELTQDDDMSSPDGADSSQRDASSTPTPKRAKVHRQQPFKPPTLASTTSGPADDTRRRSSRLSQSRSKSTAARKPLGDVSAEWGNVSPIRRSMGPAKNTGSSAKQVAQLGSSFDVSEFLADTSCTPSGRQEQCEDGDGGEDTTVDI